MEDQTQRNGLILNNRNEIISKCFKTIFKFKKIFTQITITLILPLTIIFIAHMHLSNQFFHKIEKTPYYVLTGVFEYYKSYYTVKANQTDWLYYVLFKSSTIISIMFFSLLSTAMIVYALVSLYFGLDVTYHKCVKVIPKVWKRVTVSFMLVFITFSVCNIVISIIFFFLYNIFAPTTAPGVVDILWLVYIFGFCYLSSVCQLAIVVSVLESCYGLKSMVKAMKLLKGTTIIACGVSYSFNSVFVSMVFFYMSLVVYDDGDLTLVWRVLTGIVIGVLFLIMFLLIMMIETIIYLVCKAYYEEAIDQVSLSTYFGATLNDLQPVFQVSEDIQLGRPHNQSGISV